MLHGIFRFMKECGRTAQIAPSTTEQTMACVDYFTMKPKSGKCEIVLSAKAEV